MLSPPNRLKLWLLLVVVACVAALTFSTTAASNKSADVTPPISGGQFVISLTWHTQDKGMSTLTVTVAAAAPEQIGAWVAHTTLQPNNWNLANATTLTALFKQPDLAMSSNGDGEAGMMALNGEARGANSTHYTWTGGGNSLTFGLIFEPSTLLSTKSALPTTLANFTNGPMLSMNVPDS